MEIKFLWTDVRPVERARTRRISNVKFVHWDTRKFRKRVERKYRLQISQRINDNLENVEHKETPKAIDTLFKRKGVPSSTIIIRLSAVLARVSLNIDLLSMFLRRKLLILKMKENGNLVFDKMTREWKASGTNLEDEDTISGNCCSHCQFPYYSKQ